jgi:hypothetical protein
MEIANADSRDSSRSRPDAHEVDAGAYCYLVPSRVIRESSTRCRSPQIFKQIL